MSAVLATEDPVGTEGVVAISNLERQLGFLARIAVDSVKAAVLRKAPGYTLKYFCDRSPVEKTMVGAIKAVQQAALAADHLARSEMDNLKNVAIIMSRGLACLGKLTATLFVPPLQGDGNMISRGMRQRK
jgi:hypothetical protein